LRWALLSVPHSELLIDQVSLPYRGQRSKRCRAGVSFCEPLVAGHRSLNARYGDLPDFDVDLNGLEQSTDHSLDDENIIVQRS
jgi:hypothetical protein